MKNRHIQARRAFSLMELLLVLVILGILAALVVPRFAGRTEDARRKAAQADVSSIETVLGAFEIDNGRYPTNEEGLQALLTSPSGVTGWRGPYLTRGMPKDPWNNDYIYRYPGQKNPNGYDLYSVGPDGREGGDDDIGNWD